MDAENSLEKDKMWSDILLQSSIFLSLVLTFLFINNIPQKLFSKIRLLSRRSNLQSKRHFVLGAKLLSQARSSSTPDRSSLLDRAVSEADAAVSLEPSDAAAHILKAMILELQGFNTSALDSLDAALSPLAVKSLSEAERAVALFKRAELRVATGRVDSAVDDLVESVRLRGDSGTGKVFGLLGECYEKMGLKEKSRKAYEDAVRVQPSYHLAQQALDRMQQR